MVAVADRIDGWRNDPPRRLIHRESFRASVLHHSGSRAVPQSIAAKKCLLTTPSLLSRGTFNSGVVWSRIDRRAQPLRLRSGQAGTDVLQEPQEGRASPAPTRAKEEGGVKPPYHGEEEYG